MPVLYTPTCSLSLSLSFQTARLKADFPGVQNFRCRSRDSFLHQNTSCGGPDGETKVLQDPRSSSNITVDVRVM